MMEHTETKLEWVAEQIEQAVDDLFLVRDVTLGLPDRPQAIRLRGQLQVASHAAFDRLASRLRPLGYTPVLRRDSENELDVILAMPGVFAEKDDSPVWVNVLLLVLTVASVLYAGAGMSDQVAGLEFASDVEALLWPLRHLWLGWPFAVGLLSILGAHELGHYLAGRYYRVAVSLPYFIPMPLFLLGTMGAFIRMKGQARDRRAMLTIGAAGPLAGVVVAIPVLIIGLLLSEVGPMSAPGPEGFVFLEGNSLLYGGIKLLLFGRWLPSGGYDVMIHSVALAGWAGLLVTAFNLIPAGQLDGGHVLYSLLGAKAQWLTWPILAASLALGLLWPGWWVWAGLIFLFGRGHPEPLDGITRLDRPRKALAVLVLLIFILTFTPVPIRILTAEPDLARPGLPEALWGLPLFLVTLRLVWRRVTRRRAAWGCDGTRKARDAF
jgi:Zn-dependent protease